MLDLHIRPAQTDDLAAILKLYAQPEVDDGRVLTVEQAREIFGKFKQYPNYTLYAALNGEQLVGTFALLIMDNLAHLGALSAVVEDVAVGPEWQGQGIGKFMMGFAFDICRQQGCYKMTLSSNMKRKTAHAFYERLGFKKHGFSFIFELENGE
ncbi:MAG: N-acetyltransferase family protein [Methylocystaceae bacterium]